MKVDIDEIRLKIKTINADLHSIQKELRPLKDKERKLYEDQFKYDRVLGALISLCDHDMQHDSYTSHAHVEWKKCTICGHTEKYG